MVFASVQRPTGIAGDGARHRNCLPHDNVEDVVDVSLFQDSV